MIYSFHSLYNFKKKIVMNQNDQVQGNHLNHPQDGIS